MTTHITQTTHCFTLQQLRAATQAGGVAGVSLKAHGNGFFIQIQLRTGQQAVLVTARSRSPRMFKNPVQSFGVLRRVGIVTGSFDVTHYSPEQQQTDPEKNTKKAVKKVTSNKPAKAKKVATLAPVASAPEPQATLEQASLDDPAIQIDEKETKRLTEEQSSNLGVQQSLI